MAERDGGGWKIPLVARELAAGGLSCMAASSVVNPLDAVKVRLQVQPATMVPKMYTSLSQAWRRIYVEEGLRGLLFPGMAASMLREGTYSSIRVGLYPAIKAFYQGDRQGDAGLGRKILAGLTTGGLGSALANPTDLVKIRLQGEAGRVVSGVYVSGLHAGHPPTYKGTLHALLEIGRHEGFRGLYKGVGATSVRAALLTSGQLASYDHSKHLFKTHGIMQEGVPLHIVSSLIAGVCASTACAPADMVKSRIMHDRERKHAGGQRLYKNSIDCAIKTLKQEGPFAFYRGWLPSYLRLGPHFIMSLPLLEQFRKLFGLSTL